ncbi:MAG: hypothetical protein CMB64_04760 [Euryarchaeota archaeon]|nr:hypothetical protein [Euryarchaeota archaeon]|tara:strand:- start:1568 stop:1870 length:303 start_codon:yes stop_codon:yes gene_type:complete
MPSKKIYDEIYSDKSDQSNSNPNESDYYSDNEFIPKQRYEISWYEYNQEHIINIWEIIKRYIDENGLNLLEYSTISHFTSYVAKHSYRREMELRTLSKRS